MTPKCEEVASSGKINLCIHLYNQDGTARIRGGGGGGGRIGLKLFATDVQQVRHDCDGRHLEPDIFGLEIVAESAFTTCWHDRSSG